MNSGRLNLLLFVAVNLAIVLILVFAWQPAWNIGGDGVGYYAYFRSLYFDHNFDFSNEFAAYDQFAGTHLATTLTPIGHVANLFPVGPSIFWSPFLITASFFGEGGANPYHLPGYGPNFQIGLFVATVFFLLLGLFFLYRSLENFFGWRIAFIAATAIWLVSPLVHYVLYEPSMSHVLSFAAISGLLYVYLLRLDNSAKKTIILTCFVGAAALIRWQNIIFIFVPLYYLLFDRYILWPQRLKNLLYLILTLLIVISPQLMMWQHLYGSWLALPQGGSFLQPLHPNFWGTLFSGYHGLFFWHPWLLLSLIGVFAYFKKDKKITILFLLLLAIVIYINSGLSDWMGGRAFGGRRFDGVLFIFAWGLAEIISRLQNARPIWRSLFYILILLGIGWNLTLDMATSRNIISLDRAITLRELFIGQWKMLKEFINKIMQLIIHKLYAK